ncbi:MAG: c-type cytochrome [Desulfobacteraceae bacterium]|nr:c-type cytochrome [Desulfobacteraceae bacterium]
MYKTIQLCMLSLFAFLLAISSTMAEEGDQDSKKLYMTKFCITCHGEKGIAVAPNYPNLAKQNELYLIKQVKDIIQKKRKGKLTVLMTEHPVINRVQDNEIAAIAAYMKNIKQ